MKQGRLSRKTEVKKMESMQRMEDYNYKQLPW